MGAVDHGTTTAGGLRYRLSRGLETYALKRVDAITTICEGMRNEIVARGIPLNKVTVIPDAVDAEDFPSVVRRMTRSGSSWVCKARKWLVTWVPSNAYEGLDVLINAVPRILEHAPDT